jgi:hypothetical protein
MDDDDDDDDDEEEEEEDDDDVEMFKINPGITVRSRSKYFKSALKLSRLYHRAFLQFSVTPRSFNKFPARSNDPCIFSTCVSQEAT